MLNNSGIRKQTFAGPNQILANVQQQVSVGVVVSNAIAVTEGSRKLVKAGTPLTGNLDARNTAFTVTDGATGTVEGVLLHDVDVTNGNANGTLLIFGFVNTNRLDTTTKSKINASVKTKLDAKVTFIAM